MVAEKKTVKKKSTTTRKKSVKKTAGTPKRTYKKRVVKTQPLEVEEVVTAQPTEPESAKAPIPATIQIDGQTVEQAQKPDFEAATSQSVDSPAPQPTSPSNETPTIVSRHEADREVARQERLARKQRMMLERERQRQIANGAAQIHNVTPLTPKPLKEPHQEQLNLAAQPQTLVEEVNPPTPKLATVQPIKPELQQPPPTKLQSEDGQETPLQIEIPELNAYKILSAELMIAQLENPIRAQLKAQAQDWLNKAIGQALQSDAQCVEARKALEKAINELLDQTKPKLPEGYAITNIFAKQKMVVARYNPTLVGKRFNSES
jgi:hypothetical protein